MKTKNIIISLLVIIFLLIIFLIYCRSYLNNGLGIKNYSTSTTSGVIYKNTDYSFSFSLPESWSGYSIINEKWNGRMIDSTNTEMINGPEILIRHPLWTAKNIRQDIPIMIFTYSQWNLIQKEQLSLGAAPIGPSELGRNEKYIFALPARYNFAFPTGFEEVQNIIDNKPLKINI